MKYWLLSIGFFAFKLSICAQTIWVYDSVSANSTYLYSSFRTVDLSECTYEGDGGFDEGTDITAITIPGNDTTYMNIIDPSLFDGNAIYFSDLINSSIFGYGTLPTDANIEAMGCDYNGLVYTAGDSLGVYTTSDSVYTSLGALPPGIKAGGDMTIRTDSLFLTGKHNELLLVNIEEPENSEVIHVFPESIGLIEGLATIPYSCDSIVTYAFATSPHFGTKAYHVNFSTFELTELCTFPTYFKDAATDNECILPPCDIYVDLDTNDDSGGLLNDFIQNTCGGLTRVADEDVVVFSPFPLDSLKISLIGILDQGAENIYSNGTSGINVQSLNDSTLLLINNSEATDEDFQSAIQNTFYQNNTAFPTLGNREIIFTMYSSYYSSMPSITTIVLDTLNGITLERDSFSTVCWHGNDATVLLEVENGVEPFNYYWHDGVQTAYRENLSPGEYAITIQDEEACIAMDTVIVTEPDSIIIQLSTQEDSTCIANGVIWADVSGGVAPYGFNWNVGDDNATDTLVGLPPGDYTLTITDSLGCTTNESYTLYPSDDSIFVDIVEFACEGSTVIWEGLEYTNDTTICTTTTSFYGCDSIHCVDLIFQDSFYQEENYTLCLGEELNWQGVSYYQDTSVCVIYVNEAGCDSTYCMNASFISRVNTIDASICEGDTFLFNGQSLTQAGTYTDIISDGGVCDSLIVLELESYPLPSIGINADGNLCIGAKVGLNAEGTGTYQWSTGEVSSEIEVQAGGWYYLTLTDNNGCEAIDSILLSEGSPDLSYVITPANCPDFPNGSIQIDSVWGGSPPYLYSINQSPLQEQDSFTGLEAGSYTLTVEDVDGCLRSYDVMIESESNFTFSLGDDIELSLGDSILLNPFINTTSGNLSIQWQPTDYLNCDSCIAPITKPFRTITYQAFLTDDFGCTLSDDITIVVSQKEGLFIPNAFSPNGDGRNDRLVLFSDASILTIDRFQIFDRWGSLVFERKDFLPNVDDGLNWEGMIKGQLAPIGAYTYVTVFKTVAGEEHVVSGIINLLR